MRLILIILIGAIDMKKLITSIIIGFVLVSGMNVLADVGKDDRVQTTFTQLDLSEPQIVTKGSFCSVSVPEQTAYLLEEGKPQLPLISKTFAFPIGTIIQDVHISSNTKEYILTSQIEPAPIPVALDDAFIKDYKEVTPDEQVYTNNAVYPEEPYMVHKGVGLYNDEHSVIVNVKCYSQYIPVENILKTPVSIDIAIDYVLPSEPFIAENSFDLLIITDESFVDALEPLVEHKNAVGISTKIETVQDIYATYDGVADWEEVKLRIADAVQFYGTKFVLLAGGHKGQTNEWWVPDFPSKNYDDNGMGDMDLTYSADLYFADVFRYDNSGKPFFEDWDTNNDGIYAEGPYYFLNGYDKPDYYPDVAVGRIPIRYSWEVPIVVDKIITYETTAYGSDWANKAVFAAGDTSPYERYGEPVIKGIYEGELTCNNHAKYLESKGFESIKLYASKGLTGIDEVASVISEGCGWVNMQMHANPATGGNHVTDLEEFVRFYSILHMDLFKNDGKYPFMINDGCHNAQFDVTMQEIFDNGGFEGIPVSWYDWIPCDASSWFILMEGGGAIGLIGNTGLGYGYLNSAYDMGLGGWIMPRFAHAYAVQGKQYSGTIWTQGIADYIDNFPVLTDYVDRKTIEERGLLGDPSIKIGGYPLSTFGDKEDPEAHEGTPSAQNTLGLIDTPVWSEGMSWTYNIDTVEIDISEIADRQMYLLLETGDITFTVDEVGSTTYTTTVSTSDLELFVDLSLDFYSEDLSNIIGTGKIVNASLDGTIIFDKSTLGINEISIVLTAAIETESLVPNFDFEFPPIVLNRVPEIPFSVDLSVSFKAPFELFKYPLELEKGWGLPEANFTIDGTITSPYFRILSIIDKLAGIIGVDILPPIIADFLPIIDVAEVLNSFGMSNQMDFAGIDYGLFDEPLMKCRSEQEVTVQAGTFTTYDIWFMVGAGELYYSPDAQNIVKIDANIDNYIPIIDTISLELTEYTLS